MLLNVNTRSGNPEAVVRLLQKEQPDIVLLEEISDKWVESLKGLSAEYPHQHLEPQEDNFGIGLYSRHLLKEVIHDRRIGPDVGSDHFAVIIDFFIR